MAANPSIDLDDLYQEIILDHFKHPRHARALKEDEVLVDMENPTCGDQIRLTARIKDGKVEDVAYDAKGCAISVASSSMMAEALIGKPVEEARERVAAFVGVMKGETAGMGDDWGDVIALEGVKRYPLRIKCATMAWHALRDALDKLGASRG